MHKISERSMQALMQSQQQVQSAQATASFVAQTIIDAYELPGQIVSVDPQACTVVCEGDDDDKGGEE